MKMYVDGEWLDGDEVLEVENPYDGSVVDTVPLPSEGDIERALASAVRGSEVMAGMPALERYEILHRAAELLEERAEGFARTISQEEGKSIHEGRGEVARCVQTLTLSAEEAKRLYGEGLPMDVAPGGEDKVGFTLRVPCGVVVAICPFNFPLNLVAHKVGPALATGNAIIVKSATETPLSAFKLTELLLDAGLPAEAIQCLTGDGPKVGTPLVTDDRVRKVSFTGSRAVGEEICKAAGIKKVTMELGSNSPLVVMDDADLDVVAEVTAGNGYANAGQVCISAQRVLVHRRVYADFLDALTPAVESIEIGDPLDESVTMGPLIRTRDAERVHRWIREAVDGGARLVTGGGHSGRMHEPTILADVDPAMRVSRDELFGPAVALTGIDSIEEAIALANDTTYGLSAGIFTENVHRAFRFAREVESGNVMINSGPQWRADFMPYGGLKDSGLGKEGPRYAVRDMTEVKTVVFH